MKHWLETSALVTLHFANARAKAACDATLPRGAEVAVSRYVIFELARGYLSYLRIFHNESYGCQEGHQVRNLTKQQGRHKTYAGRTMAGTLDDLEEAMDIEAAEGAADDPWESGGRKPAFFRCRLRFLIYNGWWQAGRAHEVLNPCGCREDLPAPHEDDAGCLFHELPVEACGRAGNCGVLDFVKRNGDTFLKLRERSAKLKAVAKKSERERRMAGIDHMMGAAAVAERTFNGEKCHHCGDAMICAEAREGTVVTKDGEFKGFVKALGAKWLKVPHI